MHQESRWSRRRFLATSAALAAAASLPGGLLKAQKATYIRYNITSKEGQVMLDGYRTAIKALLQLPATDPRNWYRNVLVHTLDCPHGNWWFLPWHRGYIGFFEQTVRQYSGNSRFAFPYWDWTANPAMPADFFGSDNPLDPTSSYFIKSYAKFRADYEKPINDFYAKLTPDRQKQLDDRMLSTPADLWKAIDPANGGYFYPDNSARCLTSTQPSFAAPPTACTGSCRTTPNAVSEKTLMAALSPTDFITFGSGIVDQHSQSTTQGVLESQPHNQVHNCIGGFMSDLMSPTDPVFMMHHSNIERIWLVWTAKQEKYGLPTLPEGADLTKWSAQPFLFYINSQGQALSKVAGDFSQVGVFDYVYTPASGSDWFKVAKKRPVRRNFAEMAVMPMAVAKEAADSEDGPELFAEVPVDPQGRQRGKTFHVLINPPADLDPTDLSSPHHAAAFAFFGNGHGGHMHTTNFIVQLSPALRKLKAAGKLASADQLQLFLAVEDNQAPGKPKMQPVKAKITAQ